MMRTSSLILTLILLVAPNIACSEDAELAEEGTAEPTSETGPPLATADVLPPLTLPDLEPDLEVSSDREPAPDRDPGGDATSPGISGPPTELSDWRLAYLAKAADQARRLEKAIKTLGESRLGSAALAASALAANGREAWRPQAVAWVEQALERCGGRWHKLDCEVGMLSLQRIVLQFPEALPDELLGRLRAAASEAAPPPGPELVRDPWSFRRTENQQMAVMARSLVAHRVAGTGGSAAARAWAAHARAFLLAHDRQGWYEGDSPGYMGTSVTALLLIHDHAPDPRVRALAGRQLHLLFAAWAENQVGGTPAGPRSRTYTHWAQGTRNTPWLAWAHYASEGRVGSDQTLGDWPDIATSGYDFPAPVVELLRGSRAGKSYEIRRRKRIDMGHRRDLDAATYSWVTPDYVLGTAPAVEGMALAVSGGQEIQVTLFPEGDAFSPLYLWSRVNRDRRRGNRWRSRSAQEQGVGWRHLALARMGSAKEPGHAWLAAPWSRPEPASSPALTDGAGDHRSGESGAGGEAVENSVAGNPDVLVARIGDTWVALVTPGGWRVERAVAAFPEQYAGKAFQGSWVAVPKRQPAMVGLQVGRAAEEGSWQAWRAKAAGLRLEVAPPEGGARRGGVPKLVFHAAASGGEGTAGEAADHLLEFRPGVSAAIDGAPIDASAWPLHASPYLVRGDDGAWGFRAAGVSYRLPPLADEPPPAPESPSAEDGG